MQLEYSQIDDSFVHMITLKSKSTLEETQNWLKENKENILGETLTKHGAILFRGFPTSNATEFHKFLLALNVEFGSYLGGGGPRLVVEGPIQTSTETPAEIVIPLHHELAYLTTYPSKLAFFCEIPAKQDGETPLYQSNTLYENIKSLNPEFIEKLTNKKVRYTRIIKDKKYCENTRQRSWQEMYETEKKEEAEQNAYKTGAEKVEWLEDGNLRVTTKEMEAIKIDPRTNLPTWFNSVVLLHPAGNGMTKEERVNAPWETTYGDFSTIEDEDIIGVGEIMKKEGVKFKWQAGDVLIVDNMLALHGRNSFVGPRRVLATIIV